MFNAVTFTSKRLVVALSVVAVAVAVGACGSSASTSSSSAAAGAASGTTAGSSTARLNLAKCFRANGINVSDSGSTTGAGGGGGGGGIFSALRNYPRAKVQAAEKACKQYLAAALPAANLTAAQRAARTQELVKYATCMRSHGVNIPDPTTSGGGPGGGGFGLGAGGGSSLRSLINTPAYKTANAACASLRPKSGRGAAAGGAGTSGG